MLKIREIKLGINDDLKEKIIKILNIKETDLKSFKITKKSIDARKKITFTLFMK